MYGTHKNIFLIEFTLFQATSTLYCCKSRPEIIFTYTVITLLNYNNERKGTYQLLQRMKNYMYLISLIMVKFSTLYIDLYDSLCSMCTSHSSVETCMLEI